MQINRQAKPESVQDITPFEGGWVGSVDGKDLPELMNLNELNKNENTKIEFPKRCTRGFRRTYGSTIPCLRRTTNTSGEG